MSGNGYKIGEMIQQGTVLLHNGKVERPVHEANLLMALVLDVDIAYVYARHNEYADESIRKKYFENIDLRKNGLPYQYIASCAEFMSLPFFIDSNVLIPRGDTEIAVEKVLKIIGKDQYASVLDMCTGSGCIAVAAARYAEKAKITAADISEGAIEVAKRNAGINGVEDRIDWVIGDLFEKVQGKFDIIVSNPPYLSERDMEELQKEVAYEPCIALYGGKDGLDFYHKIVEQSVHYLKKDGNIVLEIGLGQVEYVKCLIEKYYRKTEVIHDLAGIERVIVGSQPFASGNS